MELIKENREIEMARRTIIKNVVRPIHNIDNYNMIYNTFRKINIISEFCMCFDEYMSFDICDNCGDFMHCASFELTETMRHKCKCDIERVYGFTYKSNRILNYTRRCCPVCHCRSY